MKAPDLRVVLGAGGSGKTHLVNHWLDGAVGIGRRIVIFNPNAETIYSARATVIDRRADLVAAVMGKDDFQISWHGLDRDDFDFVNEVAWCAERLTLVWEEVDNWIDAGRLPDHAFRIVNQGRHRNIRVIACARRPARVSRDLTANASRIVAFRTVEPRDVSYLREFMGPGADQLRDLAPYTALDWTPKKAKIRKSPFA